MNFKRTNHLPPVATSKGPDVLRPGSANARHGQGQIAFIYTKYKDDEGKRLFTVSAGTGHEKIITQPNIVKAMLGPELPELLPSIMMTRTIYSKERDADGRFTELGTVEEYDHWKLRTLAMDRALLGRLGWIKSHQVLMLWGIPQDGGLDLLDGAINELGVSDDTILVNMSDELGTVGDYKTSRGDSKKNLTVNQDSERIRLMSRYHVATGAEKESLKQQLFGGNQAGHPYPDTTGMSQNDLAKYPWNRDHWRTSAKKADIPDPFDYGESTLCGFTTWLGKQEGDR